MHRCRDARGPSLADTCVGTIHAVGALHREVSQLEAHAGSQVLRAALEVDESCSVTTVGQGQRMWAPSSQGEWKTSLRRGRWVSVITLSGRR